MSKMTVEDLLTKVPDGRLLTMHEELTAALIPNTCEVHEFVQRVNRLIDKGELCINSNNYRHMYTPTVRNLIFKEMARRYALASVGKSSKVYSDVEYDRILEGEI